MDALERSGVPVRMIRLNEDIEIDDIHSFQVYGIYPFSFEYALKHLKSEGKKIVYDMDDALDLIEPSNPFYYSVKRDTGSQREIFNYADHITVSTQKMKEYVQERSKVPITVVPNCFSQEEWKFPRPQREGFRIGFAGSSTHVEDLIMVLPAIKSLQSKYDVRFLIMGFGQDDYDSWLKQFRFTATPEGQKLIDNLEYLMKDIKFEWIPYVDFESYPSTLINMSLDIGICPLKSTPFNDCRSASKAMEYTLSGALALASNTIPYQSEPTSILVDDDQWEEQLEFYIKNPIIRAKAHSNHLAWLRDNRDIDNKVDLLKSIYLV